jgi:glucosamine 6-phosphate synthetase-like amidotransferase/phosphosugar isomerase protein
MTDISLITSNPGAFRSCYINSLSEKDVIIGVSQSGETKDLVDIFNEIRKSNEKITLITIVNNENSTLPQEKSDFYLPIMCGSEIAVAATKSFISQIALFYILAALIKNSEDKVFKNLGMIKYCIDFTLKNIDVPVTDVAYKLFMKPSIHILGTSLTGIAKEGALKIREVVLNHTEGYDAAEFKHGPNTILGKNTIFSLNDMEKLLGNMIKMGEKMFVKGFFSDADGNAEIITYVENMMKNLKFRKINDDFIEKSFSTEEEHTRTKQIAELFNKSVDIEEFFSNYPLVFVCPPDERDKRITISQIHTHKIRGADIVLIAEEEEDLKNAVLGIPANAENYWAKVIDLPRTGDKNFFIFEAAVTLQLLALKMSVAKMKYLNRYEIQNHGVHPDVPKNVSKSITVD